MSEGMEDNSRMLISSLPPAHTFVQRLDHDISVIDTGFVRELFDASHLIMANGRAAFVDTGTAIVTPDNAAEFGG